MENKTKVKKVVKIPSPRTMWSDPYGFISNPGNGTAIPQYELNEKGECVLKKDKDGKPVCKNLYAEIQLFKGVNDYKKFISMNSDDLSALDKPTADEFIDTTQFGSATEILNAGAKIRASGKSLEQWLQEFNAYVKGIQEQKDKVVNSQENVIKKEEIKNEKKNS